MHSKPVLAIFGALLLLFAWIVFGFMGKMQATRENRDLAESRVEELKRQKEDLSSKITRLKTEEGVEENIREKFGLAKEGEKVVVIVKDESEPEPPAEEEKGGFFWFFAKWFR